MKISYNGMWPAFDVNNNWFNYLFMQYFNDDNIEFSHDHNNADITLSSVFGPPADTKNRKIFFTGESRINSYTDDQLLVGCVSNSNNSFRLPLWYIYINWWKDKFYPEHRVAGDVYSIDIDFLCSPRDNNYINEVISRPFFACAVVSNNTQPRMDAISYLSTIDKIDGYGAAFGNYYDGLKTNILENYKFNLCFENTIHPDYVTEKLLEAQISGCIPIYYGDNSVDLDFNPKSFINYNKFNSMQELAETIKSINSSRDAMGEIIAEPKFLERPSLDGIFNFFDRVGL